MLNGTAAQPREDVIVRLCQAYRSEVLEDG
jgi:hypothetical protein